MSSGKFLLGILAGAAAGATLGVLFAPAKGSETRRTLSKKGSKYAEDLKNELTDKFNELVDGVTEGLGSVTGQAEDLISGKSEFDGVKKPYTGQSETRTF